jgi:hypothetical protein
MHDCKMSTFLLPASLDLWSGVLLMIAVRDRA